MTNPPIQSGNYIIDIVFNSCVWLLLFIGKTFGLSYNAVNVLIFCVIWPLFTVALLFYSFYGKQRHNNKKEQKPLCTET